MNQQPEEGKASVKNIKDYLHFYLGCDMWEKNGHPVKLTPSYLSNHLIMPYALDNGLAKPILRPLYDITEEECDEYNKIFVTMHSLNKVQDQMETDAAATYYLLSKHFDLFGLIESGLAIDKTKLNTHV